MAMVMVIEMVVFGLDVAVLLALIGIYDRLNAGSCWWVAGSFATLGLGVMAHFLELFLHPDAHLYLSEPLEALAHGLTQVGVLMILLFDRRDPTRACVLHRFRAGGL